jgi:hypothetical protein
VFKTAPVLCGEVLFSRYAVWLFFALRAAGVWGRALVVVVLFGGCLAAVGGEISVLFAFVHYPFGRRFFLLLV